jgi:hypothetical protein
VGDEKVSGVAGLDFHNVSLGTQVGNFLDKDDFGRRHGEKRLVVIGKRVL